MLHAQLSGAASLRHVVGGLHSHANRLSHLGAAPCARSTLADANHDRPAAVFADLLAAMIQRSRPGLRRIMAGATLLIDSTSPLLNSLGAHWTRASDHA